MNVIIGCEESGTVRDAFRLLGHDAYSCDILSSADSRYHIQDDILKHLDDGWDLGIMHPPCTHLAVSGAAWFPAKRADGRQQAAIDFFMRLALCGITKLAIENPVCIMSSVWRKPDQIIQPYQFGHPQMKTTCLWLKNLPKLIPTKLVEREYITLPDGRKYPKWSYDTFKLPTAIRARERSRTFSGIAAAMADQWGGSYAWLG